jgi:catalase-peroxidase
MKTQLWSIARILSTVFSQRSREAANDVVANLLDMRTEWRREGSDGTYEGRDRKSK